ncbi:MAG: D-alanyl-D-alanine dipeptidase [Candidatus Rifleibacterium amylolyticum]|nr:MAG: D-alanyl-D-alanine dipeptidase [Candidatus Rifleibacterium amylolyticum]
MLILRFAGCLAMVLASSAILLAQLAELPRHNLVDLQALITDLVVDMPYATPYNFTGETLYPANRAFLVEPAAAALASAAELLRAQGYRLKILDAYRPLSVQRKLWEKNPDRNFVAHPDTGSRHNRGASVDLTLLTLDGAEVEMPSLYDEFGAKAGAFQKGLPPAVEANLKILQQAMQAAGFKLLASEWWHFDHPSFKDFPLLDIPLTGL